MPWWEGTGATGPRKHGVEAQVLPGGTAAAFILAATPLALLPTTVVFYGRRPPLTHELERA
jgi:hypothetical protein